MRGAARRAAGTWITTAMQEAYLAWHHGVVHSIET